MDTLALILLPACAFVGAVALVLAYRRGRALEPQRPWWERPGGGIGLSVVVVLVGVVGVPLASRRGRALEPQRPWWERPGVWIGLSMVFVLVGVFAFPRLLGFTFLFLPFVLMCSVRRGRL